MKRFFSTIICFSVITGISNAQVNGIYKAEPLQIITSPVIAIPDHNITGKTVRTKPTGIKQREVGSFFSAIDGNGNIQAQDSMTAFQYAGSHGSTTSASTTPAVYSQYDTARQYEGTDNFVFEKYTYTQQFNDADLLLNGHKHNNSTSQDDVWIDNEYYADNTVKKLSAMNYLNEDHSIYIFTDKEYNTSGNITFDSLLQEVPGNLNAHYSQTAYYDYDDQNRQSHVFINTNVLESAAGMDYFTNDWFYFYNGNDTHYYKDSAYINVQLNNGGTTIIKDIHLYTYDASDLMAQKLELTYNNPGAADTISKTAYTHDGNGNLVQTLTMNKEGGSWANFTKELYTYSGENLIQYDYYEWQNNAWALLYKLIYHYNGQSMLDLYQKYDGAATLSGIPGIPADGLLVESINYTYNEFNNIIYKADSNYSVQPNAGTGYGIVPGYQYTEWYYYVTYDDGTAVNSVDKNNINAVIYPNPAESAFTISVPVDALKNDLSFAICDMEGRLLKLDNIQQQNTAVNISGMSAGIYVLKISDRTNSEHYNQHIVIK